MLGNGNLLKVDESENMYQRYSLRKSYKSRDFFAVLIQICFSFSSKLPLDWKLSKLHM